MTSITASGRAAAIARREALSAGKAALPPPVERVRNGERTASLPQSGVTTSKPQPAPSLAATAPAAPTAPVRSEPRSGSAMSSITASGRAAAIARRQALSAGKAALPPPVERVRNGERTASLPQPGGMSSKPQPAPAIAAAATAAAAGAAESEVAVAPCNHPSCRQQARARRAALSLHGRGAAAPAAPSRTPRPSALSYAPKVVESVTHGRQSVTGLRIGRGSQVTGHDAGATLPVSGTQYIGADDGAPVRSGGPKVGLARTAGGGTISGTLVRSAVRITGDEAGSRVSITGEVDPRPEDDLTPRSDHGIATQAQFQRQADPHGHSIFGTNLGSRAVQAGSRDRSRVAALEVTEGGLPITGSALGRAVRVTGDEDGACRQISGDQYLTPARRQAECGGAGGGTAPAAQLGGMRRDPVTGGKVAMARTWGQQVVTGPAVEHDPRVTGDAPGSCSIITGTPYHGPGTFNNWCEPASATQAAERLPRRASQSAVTGDTPLSDPQVTGTARGATRSITGTPYYRDAAAGDVETPSVAVLDARFSVKSPQRRAQLQAAAAAAQNKGSANGAAAQRITGSFAIGHERLTGNLEFRFEPRRTADPDTTPAHGRLSGEGRNAGARVSGYSWHDHASVTGTEGFTAADRNPSERAGKPQQFAGAARFKQMAKHEESKQLVTGMFGWSSKSAAKVTLSGGAQG